jgi:hypothetical protein
MSYGIVVCSECRHEVHQTGPMDKQRGWQHCEDKSPMCILANAVYPLSKAEIQGSYCGKDERCDLF